MTGYRERQIEGWTVRVSSELLGKHAETCAKTLQELEHELCRASRVVPRAALRKLRRVTIWVEWDSSKLSHAPCMCYHPNPQWLADHGVLAAKAYCIDLTHARNFLAWTIEQPAMVLHELAHAYHHRFLPGGFDNAEVRRAFESARRSRRYSRVLRINGRIGRAYAMTNVMEYFAEGSEALLGTCDFYPFVTPSLKNTTRADTACCGRRGDIMAKGEPRLWRRPSSTSTKSQWREVRDGVTRNRCESE